MYAQPVVPLLHSELLLLSNLLLMGTFSCCNLTKLILSILNNMRALLPCDSQTQQDCNDTKSSMSQRGWNQGRSSVTYWQPLVHLALSVGQLAHSEIL